MNKARGGSCQDENIEGKAQDLHFHLEMVMLVLIILQRFC